MAKDKDAIATRTRQRVKKQDLIKDETLNTQIKVKYIVGGPLENRALKKTLLAEIHSHCKRAVTLTYARKTIFSAAMLLVAYGNTADLPIGFMVIAPKNNDQLEVKLICSNGSVKGVGSVLIKRAEDFARTWRKSSITLDALPGATGFYEKAGFIETDKPCATRVRVSRQGNATDGYRYSKCLNLK